MQQPQYGEQRLYIDGELTDAENARVYNNVNPATEEQIGVAADASLADAERALAAARRAFDESDWASNHSLRLQTLRRFVQLMKDNIEDLRQASMREVGATRCFALGPQCDGPVNMTEWVLNHLENFQWRREIGEYEVMGIRSKRLVWKEAAGVVAAITPWNFPIQIILAKCMPALAAGCTVVLKAAPDTPWTASLFGRLAKEAGLPAGVFNVLTASHPAEIGDFLTSDPRVDVVSFTGSTAIGKHVMKNSADTVKRVFLELGGKSAMVILEDADIASSLFGVFSIGANAGQGCAITTRLLIPKARQAEVEEILKSYIGMLGYGDPESEADMMGPLISAKQRDRVLAYIEKGKEEGARLLMGGGRPAHLDKGYYVEPTVFVDVDNSMTIAQEEIFGPVLAVIAYDDEADALRIANDSPYGLSGAVYAATEERALEFASKIRTGTININGGNFLGPDAPFGGYKQSGVGREMGPEGFEEYLETKTLAVAV